MNSTPLVLGLVAAACVTAGAAGTFIAMRHGAPATPVAAAVEAPGANASDAARPVTETEALVSQPSGLVPETSSSPSPAGTSAPDSAASAAPAIRRHAARQPSPAPERGGALLARPGAAVPGPAARPATAAASQSASPVSAATSADPMLSSSREAAPAAATSSFPESRTAEAESERIREAPRVPQRPSYVEVMVPASAVIGLQVDRALSSETARVEDRVEARVTRDVMAGGQRAIPAGSRMIGSVVLVERGGKLKDPARLGVRFHTAVLADGNEVPVRTETIFREGDSPGNESSRKIGGAAVGGAILGAILGGGKGALLGGATGAAGGTAAVMVGGRNAATLPAGAIVTARLSDPVTIQVEKE